MADDTREERAVQELRDLGFQSAGLDNHGSIVQLTVDDALLLSARLKSGCSCAPGEAIRCQSCGRVYPRWRLPHGVCEPCMRATKGDN